MELCHFVPAEGMTQTSYFLKAMEIFKKLQNQS